MTVDPNSKKVEPIEGYENLEPKAPVAPRPLLDRASKGDQTPEGLKAAAARRTIDPDTYLG